MTRKQIRKFSISKLIVKSIGHADFEPMDKYDIKPISDKIEAKENRRKDFLRDYAPVIIAIAITALTWGVVFFGIL